MPRETSLPSPIAAAVAALSQDPSTLTTQQLLRELANLRDLFDARLEAMAKAVELLQDFANRTPTTMDVQASVDRLREVVEQRFKGVENTFIQNATALTAALQAQEKQAIATTENTSTANNKTEAFFTKQLDMIGEARKDDSRANDDKLDALKERITIIESRTSVSDPTTAINLAKLDEKVLRLGSGADISSGRSAGMMAMWGLILGAIGLAAGVAAVISLFLKGG